MSPKAKKVRRPRVPAYKSFKLSQSLKHTQTKLPSAWALTKDSIVTVKNNWRLFAGITAIYGILFLIFVRSETGGIDVGSLKGAFNDTLGQQSDNITASISVFGELMKGPAAASNQLASLYQTLIFVVCSLAIIWALRQVQDKSSAKIKVKDAFYKGMYPLVPFIIVLVVITLQLVPISIAGSLYLRTIVEGLAITMVEKTVWILFIILLSTLSLYMFCSSIFAAYIVTLQGMTPLKALRAARQLVLHRRLAILSKLVWLGLALLIVFGLVIVPLIAFLPSLAEPVFFASSLSALLLVHTYLYNLYRSML